MWLATTRAFADQLESQGQHQRAVLYFLACHDIYKAIDVFKKQAMFRYANIEVLVSARQLCPGLKLTRFKFHMISTTKCPLW